MARLVLNTAGLPQLILVVIDIAAYCSNACERPVGQGRRSEAAAGRSAASRIVAVCLLSVFRTRSEIPCRDRDVGCS